MRLSPSYVKSESHKRVTTYGHQRLEGDFEGGIFRF